MAPRWPLFFDNRLSILVEYWGFLLLQCGGTFNYLGTNMEVSHKYSSNVACVLISHQSHACVALQKLEYSSRPFAVVGVSHRENSATAGTLSYEYCCCASVFVVVHEVIEDGHTSRKQPLCRCRHAPYDDKYARC